MPRGAKSRPLADRFWAKVDRRGPTECWPWKGGVGGNAGHGQVREGGASPSKLGAHRVAWELAHGEVPRGLRVLHKCDKPPCCNPNHLFLGTQQDNVDDREAKGRGGQAKRRGERNGRAKLTEADVRRIRAEHEDRRSINWLARAFGVTKTTVRGIVRRATWRHVS